MDGSSTYRVRRYYPFPLIAIAVTAMIGCQSAKLSREDIRIAAGDLRNFASASSLLIEQASAGSTTDAFLEAQTDLLLDKVRSIAKQLEGTAGEAELQRGLAHETALALTSDLEELQRNEDPSRQIKEHIDSLSEIAKSIEEQLKE
jgi:hypothetical protein